jgi:dienelactone hydrolase
VAQSWRAAGDADSLKDCLMRPLTIALGICVAVASALRGAEVPRAPSYPDHSHLRVYIDEAGQQHPVTRAEDWVVRRRHILAGMQEAMGPLPDRSQLPPLDVRWNDGEEIVTDGVRRQTISFASGDGDRVAAYLYVPPHAQGQRLPAMLALHQTSAIGKGEVAGLGANKNQAYGAELAARGYIVLAPDYPSFGDSKDYDFQADRYQSGTMKGIFNHMRAVDLLVARDDVDAARIGVIGHSLGGHNAMFVGVFDERLKVIVSSCGWTPFGDYYGGKIAGWTSDRYMPRLRDKYGLDPHRVPFDFYELVPALAPRGFFSNSPLHDDNFDVQGVKKAVAKAGEIYELLGTRDRLQVRYPDCGHDFPTEVRREAYGFIDTVLAHQPAKEVP